MTPADQTLYEAMCSDDPQRVNAATRQLTRRVKTLAMRFVIRNSGSEADAEDITQETILDVWKQMRLGAFQPQAGVALDAYMNRIVRNKWLKVIERRPKVVVDFTEDWTDEQPGEHHQLDLLKRAFDQLGEACQQMLRLFYWDDCSMEDIAMELGASADVVKTRKYRCMIKLGTLLLKKSD